MDERLTLIATMARPCRLAADVGTDHGLLICGLVESGRAEQGIATDINPMPLQKAQSEIARRGLEDKIKTLCTDGLTGVENADAVVIAGMGGELIAHIIDCWPEKNSGKTTFYLQPMTRAEHLRNYLYRGGFSIEAERCCVAKGKPYSVMQVVYTGQAKVPEPHETYLGAIAPRAGAGERAYCIRLVARLRRKGAGLAASAHPAGAAQWGALLENIERRVKNEN